MAPLLLLLYEARAVAPATATLMAVATSIAAILFTAVPSCATHAWHRSVNWRHLAVLAPVAAVTAVLSAAVATRLPAVLLVLVIAVYLGVSAWRTGRTPAVGKDATDVVEPGWPRLASLGGLAGLLGPVTGTGGGVVVSATLAAMRQPLLMAIGTSAGVTLLVAVSGTLAFVAQGDWVDLTALAGLAPACVVSAVLGARLANRMPRDRLKLVYVTVLALLSARLLYHAAMMAW